MEVDVERRLEGRVALVTGASRRKGIGRAVAHRLVEEGASVVVAGRRPPPADPGEAGAWRGAPSLVAEIEALGGSALAVEGDVTDPAHSAELVAAACKRFGRLDVVVNNAGTGRFGPLLVDLADSEWERVLSTNLTGAFYVARAAARHMIRRGGGGAIINVSSASGRLGAPRMGAYSSAKFGVIGLTQVLALELGEHGVRVNCVAPAAIDTETEDATFESIAATFGVTEDRARRSRLRRIALGRLGAPGDVAATVVFLASDDAAFVTGQTVNVSGGLPLS